MYEYTDLIDWECHGEMNTALQNFGFMWECPDYVELGKKVYYFFTTRARGKWRHYQNIYQAGYIIGERLDLKTRTLKHGKFHD